MMIVLIIWERLTKGSPRSMPIAAILLTIKREVRIEWSSLSPIMAQASPKAINLLLHVFGILLMRDVAFTPRLTLTGVGRMHTSLSVPFRSRSRKWSWRWDPIDSAWCGSKPTIILCWIHYNTNLPTNGANCKDHIWLLSPKGGWTSAQRAQNNEFVENGLEKLGLNESDKY